MAWYILSGSIFCFLFIEILKNNTPINIPDANIYTAGFMGFIGGLLFAFSINMLIKLSILIWGLF
jgi:hypothetical protein